MGSRVERGFERKVWEPGPRRGPPRPEEGPGKGQTWAQVPTRPLHTMCNLGPVDTTANKVELVRSRVRTAGGDTCRVSCPAPGTPERQLWSPRPLCQAGTSLPFALAASSIRGGGGTMPQRVKRSQDPHEALGPWSQKVRVLNTRPAAQECGAVASHDRFCLNFFFCKMGQ